MSKQYGKFRRVDRKVDALAARTIRRIGEIMDKADLMVSPQYVIESLAHSLRLKDEQLFKWLLESLAAQKLREPQL
jgi:hypothetical protein